MTKLIEFLQILIERGAEELLLSSGHFPQLRSARKLTPLRTQRCTLESLLDELKGICSEEEWIVFLTTGEYQCSRTLESVGRFRVSLFLHLEGVAASFRMIPTFIPKLSQLGFLSRAREVLSMSQGLIVVTGPMSSGRSTIVAAMLQEIAASRSIYISTLERSVEFQIQANSGIITQNRLPSDNVELVKAIRRCIADRVDVLFVESIRDPFSFNAILEAVRSGILVITISGQRDTQSVLTWLSRLLSPEPEPWHWRELANAVSAVISQQLVPRIGGGLAVANEIYVARPYLRDAIRLGDLERMMSAWTSARETALMRMDQCLLELVNSSTILEAEAYECCMDRATFRGYMKNPPLDA